jgi:hypothetical protein
MNKCACMYVMYAYACACMYLCITCLCMYIYTHTHTQYIGYTCSVYFLYNTCSTNILIIIEIIGF